MSTKSIVAMVARRFVTGGKSQGAGQGSGFVSFIATVSVFGLSLGVTALLVVTSVMNGFEKELSNTLTAFHAHVILFSRGEPVQNPAKHIADIKKNFPEVQQVSPYVFTEAMLSSAKGVSGSVVEGIDKETFGLVSRIPDKVIAGRLPQTRTSGVYDGPLEITLGAEIARKLAVSVGDSLVLTIPFMQGGGQPLAHKMRVTGIIRIGMYDYDSKYALVDLVDAQELLGLGGKVNAFKILVNDAEQSHRIAAALNDRFVYPLRARDWSSLNRNLFYAIKLEKAVIGIILYVIILVASFNIISTILMMASEKQRQVSMLKAIGLRPMQAAAIFLLIGGCMSVAGASLGLLFGRGLCGLLQWKSIIDLPADIYLLSRLPIDIRLNEWALVAVASVALAMAAALWPSLKVSRQLPVEGLRHE